MQLPRKSWSGVRNAPHLVLSSFFFFKTVRDFTNFTDFTDFIDVIDFIAEIDKCLMSRVRTKNDNFPATTHFGNLQKTINSFWRNLGFSAFLP